MKAKLVVVGGEAKTAEIRLKLPTVIGRGREASLMLPHPLVSRQHCEIFESGGKLVVRDMGFLNGTFINNERITEAVLPNGELLTIGTVTFRAVYESSVESKGSAKGSGKASGKGGKSGRNDRTVGQPSDPTVDTGAPQRPTSKTQPAPLKTPAIAKSKGGRTSDTPPASQTPRAPVPKSDKSQRAAVGKEASPGKQAAGPAKSEPFTATHDPTRQLPPDPERTTGKPAAGKPPGAATPKKKVWADSSDEMDVVEFQHFDDDLELGEDESIKETIEGPPAAGEFTVNTLKTLATDLPGEDDDDFNVEEIDFASDAPLPQPALAAKGKEKTSFPAGELTTNFDPQSLTTNEQPKDQGKAQKNKAKTPDPKAKAQETKAPQGDSPPKGTLGTTDEDLEAFFKSLG